MAATLDHAEFLGAVARADQKMSEESWAEAARLWELVVATNPVEARY